MLATLLLVALAAQDSSAPFDPIPGVRYSRPAARTILRAGPGQDFLGVLTLAEGTLVRVGADHGAYREVFTPEGFGAFVHQDFVRRLPEQAEAWIEGDRVNLRAVPSADASTTAIAQLERGTGPLVVLGEEGEWVRILAPVGVPLFARAEELPTAIDSAAAADWKSSYARRAEQQAASRAAWVARHPEWQREEDLAREVETLLAADLAAADDGALHAKSQRLAQIAAASQRTVTRGQAEAALLRLQAQQDTRATASQAVERAVERAERTQLEPSLTLADLQREAHILGLNLRYSGRGEDVLRRGTLRKLTAEDGTEIYTLLGEDGETYKLTGAPADVHLPYFVGRTVEMRARKLALLTVRGPVLVVDGIAERGR